MTEPRDDAADDQDPEADTPDDVDEPDETETPDQPEQPDTDWETRYKEQQKLLDRQGAELGIYRRGGTPTQRGGRREAEPADDGEPDDAGDDDGEDGFVQSLSAESWELAEARYGPEAVGAYGAAYRILERAQTPADFIAAFEAYHNVRSQGGTAEDAAAAASGSGTRRSRAQAVQPKVDPNRSDAGPDLTDKDVEEARKSNDLGTFVHAATRRMGFGDRR